MASGSVKKKTIGLILENVFSDFAGEFIRNVLSGIQQRKDLRLVVVAGRYDCVKDQDEHFRAFHTIYNSAYQLEHRCHFDGLIICLGSMTDISQEQIQRRFEDKLKSSPFVFTVTEMKDYVSVNYDNETGIKEALSYLIEKKGIRNIGMIGGPDWNNDAHERRLAYEECLREHGIEIKDNWYIEGDLTEQVIAEAGELLDMAPEIQAIFCVNDSTAIGLYDVMRRRGLEPGSDICVFGFDNLVSGAMMNPSLSTIDANTTELAGYAYKMLMRMLCGEEVGEEKIPTRFICRDSFGNASDAVDRGGDQLISKLFLDHYFDQVFYRYRNHEMEDGSQLRLRFIEVMSEMIDITRRIDVDDAGIRRLTDKIKSFLKNGALDYTDYDELIPYMQRVHSEVTKCFTDDMRKKRASEVLAVLYKYIIKIQNNRKGRYHEY